jgi:uncharacterized membrane protein YsdA (DUF1294 family)
MRYFLALYAIGSVVTFVVYGIDKRRAGKGRWRIPEATLHLLELCFGFPGAIVARRVFRHKLHKPKFTIVLYAIVTLHALAWTWWWTRMR